MCVFETFYCTQNILSSSPCLASSPPSAQCYVCLTHFRACGNVQSLSDDWALMLVHCWSRVSHFFPQFPHLSNGDIGQYLKDGRLEANLPGSICLKVHSSTFITAPNWKQPPFHQYGERAYGIFVSWILFSCQSEQIIAVASTMQMHL